jgi:hypothetical protein
VYINLCWGLIALCTVFICIFHMYLRFVCTVISGRGIVILCLFSVGGVTLCNNAYKVKLYHKLRGNPPLLSSFMNPYHSYICHKMTVMDISIIVINNA